MADNQNVELDQSSMKADTTMNLSQFLKQVDEPEPAETTPAVEEQPEEESELDKAIKAKSTQQKGLVVNTDELKDDDGPKQYKSVLENEERDEDFREKSGELDDLTARAKRVHVIHKPEHPIESSEMMTEISSLIDNGDGTLSFPEGVTGKYVVPYTKEEVDELLNGQKVKPLNSNTIQKASDENTEENEDNEETRKDEPETDDAYKDAVVKIIIDKTGLGTDNIEFTEEEKKYIEQSKEIEIVEVESKELETLVTDKTDITLDSYLGTVNKYQFATAKTPVVFPGSGFRADMLGLTYSEFTDIALDVSDDSEDMYDFDKMYKKLTVIYNKMANISSGKFESFEDFLRHFAQIDVPLATFGLAISSQPEEDEISLNCQAEGCKKKFTHRYIRRSLIDFEDAPIEYLEEVKKITNARPEDYGTLQKNALVNRRKAIKLPTSNFIVEIGLSSCYEYLYDIISLYKKINTDKDISENDSVLALLLTSVRSISMPTDDGKYVKFVKGEDIFRILIEKVPPLDVRLLWSINIEFASRYEIPFTLRNVECPHCHTKTKKIPMTPDEMVFFDLNRMLSTPLTIKTILDF